MEELNKFLEDYEKVIQLIEWCILLGVAIYSSLRIRIMSKKNRYDFYKEMRSDFLNRELLEKRKKAAEFWVTEKLTKKYSNGIGSINCPRLSEVSSYAEFQDILEDKLGLKMVDEVDDDFVNKHREIVKDTEDVLNVYEHIGKLVNANIISIDDAKIFFYTMIADSFVVFLPFILYRRKSKPEYAQNMQNLIKQLPMVSSDIVRV